MSSPAHLKVCSIVYLILLYLPCLHHVCFLESTKQALRRFCFCFFFFKYSITHSHRTRRVESILLSPVFPRQLLPGFRPLSLAGYCRPRPTLFSPKSPTGVFDSLCGVFTLRAVRHSEAMKRCENKMRGIQHVWFFSSLKFQKPFSSSLLLFFLSHV